MKICPKCKIEKEDNQFYKRSGSNVLRSQCKDCKKLTELSYEQRVEIIQKRKAQREPYLEKTKTRVKEYQSKPTTKEKRLHYYLTTYFGITKEDYNNLLKEQNHTCAICNKVDPTPNRRLAVDHNHKTNEIRGLLCGKCNIALGLFDDNTDLMLKAIEYLKYANTNLIKK